MRRSMRTGSGRELRAIFSIERRKWTWMGDLSGVVVGWAQARVFGIVICMGVVVAFDRV